MLALRFLLAAFGIVNVVALATLDSSSTHKSLDGPFPYENKSDDTPVISQLEARRLTNGRRLALGLPLLPPHRRSSKTHHARTDPSAVPSSPDPDEPVVSYSQGRIDIRAEGSGTLLGYVGKNYVRLGTYGMTTDITLAMLFAIPTDAPSTNLVTINGPDASNPYFGAFVGPASTIPGDLLPGLANYCFLISTTSTPVDSVAISGKGSFTGPTGSTGLIETAIWHYDATTGVITPRWVNTDLSKSGYLVYYPDVQRIIIVGDKEAFDAYYGATQSVYFTFVPTS